MDKIERRRHLLVRPDPDPRMDYVVTLAGRIAGERAALSARVEVRYVPDRQILDPDSLLAYLGNLGPITSAALEEVGGAVLDDINNEVVPRWVQVSVAMENREVADGPEHSVLFEDRQPRWDNPQLLGRLRRH